MMDEKVIDLKELQELSELFGVSGHEQAVVEYLDKHIDFDMKRDAIGSALFTQGNEGVRIMIATHMDEVGFYLKKITDEGYLKLQPVGNIWTHVLLNQEVAVVTSKGDVYYGIIGSKATHGISPKLRAKTVDIEDVFVDMGVTSKKTLLNLGIKEGNMVVPVAKSRIMNDPDFVSGKAFDNRASCAVGLWTMKALKENPSKNTVTLAATVQEEVGLRGARTTADLIYPDLAIAIDVTLAGDTPTDQNNVKLGKGVSISVIDSMTIMHRGILSYVESLCEKEGIDYQLGCFTDGGTDAGNIHKSRSGIPSITLSIPMRYMHTHRGVVNVKDIKATHKLIMSLVRDLTKEKYEQILEENYCYQEKE